MSVTKTRSRGSKQARPVSVTTETNDAKVVMNLRVITLTDRRRKPRYVQVQGGRR